MRNRLLRCRVLLLVLSLLATLAPGALATSMVARNVVDLIDLSQRVVVGEVIGLRDGFDAQQIPYTEITLRVEETLLGDEAPTLTFRQFGLLQPRDLPGGRTYVGVSPDGWPRFAKGERVLLFLYKPASLTGLQTTVGLLQGKFSIRDGRIVNALDNQNLFHEVGARPDLASGEFANLLALKRGPVDAKQMLSFLRQAIGQRWVKEGRVFHAQH